MMVVSIGRNFQFKLQNFIFYIALSDQNRITVWRDSWFGLAWQDMDHFFSSTNEASMTISLFDIKYHLTFVVEVLKSKNIIKVII